MNLKNQSCEIDMVHEEVVRRAEQDMPSGEMLAGVAELFKVFGDYTRTRIISALFYCELCVCDIASLLKMTKSAVSHQLRILRQTKIVKNRREGKEVFYSLDDHHVKLIYEMALLHLSERR